MANRDDEDIQHKGRKLWQALKSDPVDHQKIRDLLRNGAPANFREPGVETNRTPLHFVVCERNGDEDLMDMLLEREAQANLGDCFDLTPLHLAAERGNLKAVKILLRNPSSPADHNKPSCANETPLQIAERNGHDEVVRYLLKEDRTEVSSDGVSLVDVSKDGTTVTCKITGQGNVNLMVGDNNKMDLRH